MAPNWLSFPGCGALVLDWPGFSPPSSGLKLHAGSGCCGLRTSPLSAASDRRTEQKDVDPVPGCPLLGKTLRILRLVRI